MAKLLYIKASPRGSWSESLKVTDAFVSSYRERNPKDEVLVLDVFKRDLMAFDGLAVTAKYAILHGGKPSKEEAAAWRGVEVLIEEFKSADKYVFAVPMWNFSIPYRLKQYMDILVQPTYTFSYSPQEGYKGLVTGRRALVVYARGGQYPAGSDAAGFDMQKPYMELILGFMGITDVKSIVLEPMLELGPQVATGKIAEQIDNARRLVAEF